MNNIRNIINEVAKISASAGAPDLTWPLAGLLEKGDKAIDEAVVGQFKSVKSSLINSLTGEAILPVCIVPDFINQNKLDISCLIGNSNRAFVYFLF